MSLLLDPWYQKKNTSKVRDGVRKLLQVFAALPVADEVALAVYHVGDHHDLI